MSFMDDYQKALKKKKQWEEEVAPVANNAGFGSVRIANVTPTRKAKSDSTFMEQYQARLAEIQEEERSIDERLTVGRYSSRDDRDRSEDEEEERTWFQRGAFEDGYQFGDVTRTILGTTTDLVQEAAEGVVEMGENVVDATAWLVGGVGGLMGASDYQYAAEKFIEKDLIDSEEFVKWGGEYAPIPMLLNLLGTEADEASVLGERTDSLVNSGGQLLATMGLQSLGVPWWVTSGVTSFGSEAENALNQGASYGEAGASAAISAGAEVLTEKLFGGSGLGEKGMLNLAPLTRGITNKVVKVLADHGLDILAEGSEEVVSQIFSNLGSSLYREEKLWDILTNEEALDGYLESFVGGGVLGGIMNVGKASNSVKTGRDYRTGLNENEQKVFDQIYEERIAEAEKDHNLNKNEKAEIYDEVMEDIEKGYLSTDDIERILGGESYEAYKTETDKYSSLREQYEALQKEYEELGNKSNATLAEQTRYGELQKQILELQSKINDPQSEANRNLLQAQLSQNVYEQTKNDKLRESYFELVRSKKKYQADLNKYKGRARDVIKQVMDSGLADGSRRTHEFWDIAANLAESKGMDIAIADQKQILDMLKAEHEAKGIEFDASQFDGKIIDGYTNGEKIFLNAETKRGLNFVVGHEITHTMEGGKHYDAFQKLFKEYAKGEYQSRFDERSGQYKKIYAADEKYRTKINREVTADLVGDYLFNDKNFVRHLTKNQNVFQAVWNEVKYLAKIATAGSQQARQLEKVKREFERAWRERGKAQGDGKLSVSDTDGKQLSKGQQDFFKDSKMRDEQGNLKVMYHGSQDAGFHVFDAKKSDDDISFFFVDRNDVASTYSGTSETYEARTIRTAEDMNNFLAEIGYDQYEAVEKDGQFELLENNDHVAYSDTAQGIYEEFCWYEGVGEGDANYKVYLNLTNPLEVDAQGRNWNRISNEFSQEVYDRYQSLTEEEKADFVDLAEWEDFSTFKEGIYSLIGQAESPSKDEVSQRVWGAYQKLQDQYGEVDMYQLFDISAEGFTDEAIRENSTAWLKTRDYAQKAKAEGYDGVIFKNIVDNGGYSNGSEGASTVAIAFESNQIKSVANENPTGDADIRYSVSDAPINKITNDGLTMTYVRVPNQNTQYYGSRYGQNIEPAGEYMSMDTMQGKYKIDGYEYGTIQFKKPLVLEHINTSDKGWKKTVSDMYGGLTGKALTKALVKDGYDAIVTYDEYGYNEVVNLNGKKLDDAKNIRFSLSEAVEETKDLMALHNLTGEKLLKSLKLGGLPMPSVAIAKAKDGHSEFGEISLILPKESIDPDSSSRNKLYSGDAWTPTYPKVDFKPSEKVLQRVKKKISALVPYEVRDVLGNLLFDTDNATDSLNRYGGDMVEAYKRDDAMKYAYLKDTGSDISLPMKEEDLVRYGEVSNAAVRYFSGKMVNGLQSVDYYQNMSARDLLQDKDLTEAVADVLNWDVLRTLEPGSPEYNEYERNPLFLADEITFRDIDRLLSGCRKLFTVGVRQTVDRRAAKELVRDAVDQTAYESWLADLFEGVVEKEGIRNNKDYFTPSGNRRSFEALHYEHNLENVIKAMREKGEKGIGFGGGNIFGASTREFSSVEDMKKSSDRLQHMSEDEYQKMKDGFTSRFFELASSLPMTKNSFSATDDAATVLTEAVAKYKTRSGIANYLKRELKGWATYSEQVVDDLIELVNDIRNMPTGYFEAKPQRAVGFDEVGVFVIPNNADVKLKQELLNRGYAIAEYDPNVEGHRQQVVNQFEEYKFSLSDVGQEQKRGRGWYVPSHYNPVQTEVAPTQTEVAPVQENLPTIEFPDDLAPVQAELESLIEEEAELRQVMEGYAGVNDIDAVNRLLPEYEAIQERIRVLQQSEAERTGSITDADAPVEVTREYDSIPDNIPLTKDATEWITGNVVAALGLDGKQKKNVRNLIQQYSDNQLSREHLYEAVREQFGTYKETEVSEELKEVKAKIRTYGINVSESIKKEIPDYNDLRKRYFGKVRFSKQGLAVDEAYREFMEVMPGYFDENLIGVPTDQFMRILEVADADPKTEIVREMDAESIQEAADAIIEGVNDFRQIQREKDSETFAREGFDSLMRDANLSAPVIAKPVKDTAIGEQQTFLPTAEAKTTKSGQVPGQQAISKEFIQGESDRTAEIVFGRDKSQAKKLTDWQWAQEHIFRHGAAVEDLALATGNRELQARFDMIRRAESMAQHFIGKGEGNVKALLDIRKAVEDAGKTRPFNYYLYHMLNVDRMTLEERFGEKNKAVFGDTTTAEDSRQAAANLLRMNPQFKEWADQIYAITKHMREQMVNGGVISRETADWLEKKYPHYVPINRVFHDGKGIDVPLDTKRTGVNSPIKKAQGGDSNFDDAFDILASRIEQTYKAVAKNRFGVELKNTLRSAIEAETADAESVVDDVGFHEELLQEGKNGESPTFTVFENGKRVKFEITNDLYEAMKPSQFTWTNPVLNKLNNVRRDILTTYSPTFMMTNPIKDIGDIVLNSQHPVRTYAEVPEAIWEVISKGKWYQERMRHGGDQDTFFDSQKRLFKKEPSKFVKAIGFPIEKLKSVNEAIEQIPRMAEYIASRKMGRSIDVSMLDAARVTTNFGASGDFTNMINRNGFTFLGASVEGFNQQVRNVREAKAEGLKGWAKLAGKYLAAGLPAMILNHLLWDDDEEYAELSDYVKQNYYIVAKFGDDTFLRIPKGRAVAVIQDAFQQMENFITGNDEVDLGAFAQLVVNNLAPNNPLDNNIIAPIAQAWSNTTWYGDDLVPTRLQDVPTAEQYDETTDAISRWLGERTNISPYKWNYILDQYSGGVGDMILPYLTPEQDGGGMGAAFRDKFTTNSTMNNQNVSDFYDLLEELTVNANASTATDEDELMSKYMNSINSELSKLYQQKREIQNMDIPDADKYELVKEVQEQIVDLMKEGMANYQGISYEDDYREGGTYARVADRLYELTDEGEWKKLTDEQVTKYEVTKAAGDASYASDGTNHYRWYEPEEGSDVEPGWRKITDKELERQEEITSGLGISPEEYWEKREEYSYAYEHPESYAVAQAVGGYDAWVKYSEELYDIKADKDEYGKSISGSRKDHVIDYLNSLDADYYTKIILFKSEYNADDTYNEEIIDYLNSREDISYAEMEAILKKLGFYVDAQGNISW